MEFSELALQKLIQLFPELANFIVTFKDVTGEINKGEDSDISVGIFILQFGRENYYIPVVGKGEVVQPVDSIFNIEEQKFTPLTKNFIQKAINSSQLEPGKRAKIPNTIIKNPSVYDMVTPPRTGKFVYASASRLTEFLSVLPNMVKKAMLDKVSADKDIYDALHKLFGLENILSSLRPTASAIRAIPKPAVELITEGKGLDNATVQSILEKGYALRGENTTNRIAILANDFDKSGVFKQIGAPDIGMDYDIVTKAGEARSAYIPKRAAAVPQFAALVNPHSSGPMVAIFDNGDYSTSTSFVVRGGGSGDKSSIKNLFAYKAPCTPKDLENHGNFALFSPELELIGIYGAREVSHGTYGTSIRAHSKTDHSHDTVIINAYRNCKTIDARDSTNIFIPYNTLVVKLGHDIGESLEVNVNAASAKFELSTLSALGSAINVGYDGIEFTCNGKPVGHEGKMIEVLVVHNGIEPSKAESFIKQAKERKSIKIYLSKQADFEPGEIPQFGNAASPQEDPWDLQKGLGSNFAANVKDSLQTGDAQTAEATILSELLQVSNVKEYIKEYLPDIKEGIDKLGRSLFLVRLNVNDLNKNHSANEITSFINNLRNVYRMLGDNYIKLEQMSSDSEMETKENK